MTLLQLTYFERVAERGHLTQAAKELLIAQPSLSQAIRKLEDELGFPLFEKKGRVLILTKEGKEFLPYAREVVETSQKAERSVHNIYMRYKGNVKFAYTRPLPQGYIPNLIQSFFKQNQAERINIETYSVPTSGIFRDLKEEKIDFGFCSESESEDESIQTILLMEHPICLIAGENDPLLNLTNVRPEDLLTEPGISYTEGSSMDRKIMGFFDNYEIYPDIRYRTSSEEIQNFVSCGLGWAFIAKNDTPLEEGVHLLNMPEMKLKRSTYLAVRKDRNLGEAAAKFLDYVLEYNKMFQLSWK